MALGDEASGLGPYRCKHLGISGGQVLAQALMPGELLHHMQRHTTAHGRLGQAAAEAMGETPSRPIQAQVALRALSAACRDCGLVVLPAAGKSASVGLGAWPYPIYPGSPLVDQGSPQSWGDRHLAGLAGLGGDGPVGEAAIDVCPAQGQGFGDEGGRAVVQR